MRSSLLLALVLSGCTPTWDWDGDDTDDVDSADPDGACQPDPSDPTRDTDGDRLSDAEELQLGTDPCLRDTDGDGYSDGIEVDLGSNPTNPTSKPDGNVVEVSQGETDSFELSFTIRIQQADVAFLIDTTGSMGSLANAMAQEFSSIVSDLSAPLPDTSYGVATYDDYAYSTYGYSDSGDRPFILRQQQTTDLTLVQHSLSNEVQLHYGGDGPESTIEAIYQGITGAGYDQNCDKIFDPLTDVMPFRGAPGDPFAGSAGGMVDPTTPGGGNLGGFGFRRGALPIIIYGTDNELRDPDAGYGVPPGCPKSAGASDVVSALDTLGGRLIGISVNSWGPGGTPQMEQLAYATGSVADLNGDGLDDPLVVQWNGSSGTFRSLVVNAVTQLVGALTFAKIDLKMDGDGVAFVETIDPSAYYDVGADDFATPLVFKIHLRGVPAATEQDQVFNVNFRLMGDGVVQLDQRTATIVVPGTGVL